MRQHITLVGLLTLCFASLSMADGHGHGSKAAAMQCPTFLNHEYRRLHSQETVNLCDKYTGKPILFVNTASHCGFTKQFGSLEELYQKYKDAGFQVIGFASNDFNQEAKDEAKAAGICFKNYGVTFTMIAPTRVKGEKANPTFAHLGQKTEEPSWNFNKYLVKNGEILHFGSRVTPVDSELENAVSKALKF